MHPSQEQAIYPGSELFLIKQFMQNQHIPAKSWLMGTGLNTLDLKNPSLKVSLHQFDTVYRNVYRLCRRPAIGLELGKALNLSRWGVLAMALQSSKHLGDALSTARDYRILLRSRFRLETVEANNHFETRIYPQADMTYPVDEIFAMEMLIGSILRLIKDLCSEQANFSRVQLSYHKPPYSKLYESYLGCPVTFSQPFSAIVMDKEQVMTQMPLANLVSKRQALILCENDLQRLQQTLNQDTAALVMQALNDSPQSQWSLPLVAKSLAMSERNLRRKLQVQGKEFRQLKQHRQMQLAMELLTQNQPISKVAELCGFKDLTSFRSRFKSSTGFTPSQFLKQHNQS